jgi:tRNA 2-selenouridine synthase
VIKKINTSDFLNLAINHPVFDVRSPGEYLHAHIPGAFNLPLFSDEERKIVGTAYKQEGKQPAIKYGLEFFGPKLNALVDEAKTFLKIALIPSSANTVLLHCWRGGMRSAAVAWLLDLYGFEVYLLEGGYKAYRQHVLAVFDLPLRMQIIGGYTGSNKTGMLHQLKQMGHAVIDLEHIALHKGSAFGGIDMEPQPTQEMFENKLAVIVYQLYLAQENKMETNCWIEDESQRLGKLHIPHPFWNSMRQKTVFFLDIPFEERLKHIITCYGNLDKEKLITAVIRIRKRLGPLESKNCINFLLEDNVQEAFRILLQYYDKTYQKSLQNREKPDEQIQTISLESIDAIENTHKLLACTKNFA